MAVAHYQFEAIHPFQDGNGRTGRVINILMLIEAGLLQDPILYLSRAIIARKNDYYRLLRAVTSEEAWIDWITSTTGSLAQPYRYGSGYTDTSTGPIKLGARYYDPVNARFTQHDPTAQEQHPYTYSKGCPTSYNDPTGGLFNPQVNRGLAVAGLGLAIAAMGVALFAGGVGLALAGYVVAGASTVASCYDDNGSM